MVLVTSQTACAICGELIAGGKASAVEAFVRNTRDPLYAFSGRAFHAECFRVHPLRAAVLRAVEQRQLQMRRSSFECAACREPIDEDGCTTDLLTTEDGHPLLSFNYLHFHRAHVQGWVGRPDFEHAVDLCVRAKRLDAAPMIKLRL